MQDKIAELEDRMSDCKLIATALRNNMRDVALETYAPTMNPISRTLMWWCWSKDMKTPSYWERRANVYSDALARLRSGEDVDIEAL